MPRRPPSFDLLLVLFLIVGTVAVFWQVESHGFINYDDPGYVTKNPHIRQGFTRESLTWALTATYFSNWHPLTWLSYMLDYRLFGDNPRGYHVVNVGLHAANTVLLFVVLRRMTGVLWPSVFVAALFGIHPMHVESVVWVAERKDVLSTLFWLLAMGAYARYAERPRAASYVLVLACFALGLMAKPMVVTLPFVFLLLDYWPLQRFAVAAGRRIMLPPAALIVEKMPFFALVAASSVITYVAQVSGGAVASLEKFPLSIRLMNAAVSYLEYIHKMVWPFALSLRYPHPGHALPLWQALGAAVLLVLISIGVCRQMRQRPYLVVGWFWYVGTLVPVIGLVQVGEQAMADRYTYLPFIGLFIILAWGVWEILNRWQFLRPVLTALAAVLLAVLMVTTWFQVRYWRDSVTLYEHSLAVTSGDFLLHYNLANELRERGDLDAAVGHYAASIRANPTFAEAYTNAGPILAGQGRVDEAIACYAAALKLKPDLAEAHNNLGILLAQAGRTDEAIDEFSAAVRIKPELSDAQRNLQVALSQRAGAGQKRPGSQGR
ncbi:MAG: tetratricopeptide repeat protein [Nitrospirae bacterium]|nr:tetratricopeptide repeat protein [Nitrospirota bacterium]